MIKVAVLLAIWFVIGAIAASQRDYFDDAEGCSGAGTILVNVLAGPLNYVGANPKVTCEVPQPSP
ncbi:MAG TPA: hypothetical protein VNA20_04175 [Frankiaceae bacterium]|nr:hypothetical protein [Frankiaceae bacterium]